ncbi:MAG: hypothetical protein F6J93_30290 [Oscillatoria sp. SIO1A7]|nr:hypothetical protein [Oscillatoria sp. SIO1A7]
MQPSEKKIRYQINYNSNSKSPINYSDVIAKYKKVINKVLVATESDRKYTSF